MRSTRVKLGQTKPSKFGVKQGAKQGQMRSNKVKQVQTGQNRGETQQIGAKLRQIGQQWPHIPYLLSHIPYPYPMSHIPYLLSLVQYHLFHISYPLSLIPYPLSLILYPLSLIPDFLSPCHYRLSLFNFSYPLYRVLVFSANNEYKSVLFLFLLSMTKSVFELLTQWEFFLY